MKRLHTLPPFFLALLLVLTLSACEKESPQEPSPLEEESMDALPADSTAQPSVSGETLRLFLPKGAFFDVVSTVSTQLSNHFTLSIEEEGSTDDTQAALLDGLADLIVLSPQNAATLYRNGEKVQIVAVVAPSDPTIPDSLSCLVGKADFLSSHQTLVSDFQKACVSATLSSASDAFFSINWDMVDLVQQSLEDQYAQSPDPAHSIPDAAFYCTAT